MRDKMKKNPGLLIYELLDETDLPFLLWMWSNMDEVWQQTWKYHARNKNTTEEEKQKFNRYKSMKKSDVHELSVSEKAEWNEYKVKDTKYTSNTKKVPFKECVSDDGYEFYYKTLGRWKKFLRDEEMKRQFDTFWMMREDIVKLGEKLYRARTRKRKNRDDEMPPLPSPNCVMCMPGEDGYEDYLLTKTGYGSDSNDSDDDMDE
jgi:tRNA G10  N-methylase Trm11